MRSVFPAAGGAGAALEILAGLRHIYTGKRSSRAFVLWGESVERPKSPHNVSTRRADFPVADQRATATGALRPHPGSQPRRRRGSVAGDQPLHLASCRRVSSWARTSRPGRARSPTTRCSPSASGKPAAGCASATRWSSSWPPSAAGDSRRAADDVEAFESVRGEAQRAGPRVDRLALRAGGNGGRASPGRWGDRPRRSTTPWARIRTWLLECMERTVSERRTP